MLVQYYVNAYDYNFSTGSPATTAIESPQILKQVADITTIPVISEIAVEGSFATMITMQNNNLNFSLGGEFWGRTKECLKIDFVSAVDQRLQNLNDFAVIGRQLSNYQINGQGNLTTNYCEPAATINKSQDPVQLVGSVGTVTKPTTLPSGIADATKSENRIPANVYDALDITGAQAAAIFTGKIFGHVCYTWSQHRHMPSLTLITGAEFSNKTSNFVSLWNVGIEGSLQF